VTEAGWEAATFAGLEARQRQDVAALSPERRMEWLELAAQSGALANARRQRQEECDALWAGSHRDLRRGPGELADDPVAATREVRGVPPVPHAASRASPGGTASRIPWTSGSSLRNREFGPSDVAAHRR
jgi:hypothetical protein